jgi:hypothetical protein
MSQRATHVPARYSLRVPPHIYRWWSTRQCATHMTACCSLRVPLHISWINPTTCQFDVHMPAGCCYPYNAQDIHRYQHSRNKVFVHQTYASSFLHTDPPTRVYAVNYTLRIFFSVIILILRYLEALVFFYTVKFTVDI